MIPRKARVDILMATTIDRQICIFIYLTIAVQNGITKINVKVRSYKERKSRDLVLALESTGDLGCFDACVKNKICVWVYSQN